MHGATIKIINVATLTNYPLLYTVSTQEINMNFIDQLIILNVFGKACSMLVSKKFNNLQPNLMMNKKVNSKVASKDI